MMQEKLLACLFRQAAEDGASRVTLEAIVEESSQRGARRALEALGLHDMKARADMDELRALLAAWRDAKKSARAAFVGMIVKIVLLLALMGLAYQGAQVASEVLG